MRISRWLWVVVFGMAGLVPAWAINVLDLKTQYAATSVIGSGANVREGRLWRTPNALRHEMVEAGRQQIAIARLDRKLAWLLLPDQRLAIEMGLKSFGLPMGLLTGDGLKQTPVGQETIAGRRTTKVRVEREPGTSGPHFEGFVWTTAEGIVMKVVGTGEHEGRRGAINVSFRDIQPGRQDPALFEVPTGYRRLVLNGVDLQTFLAGLEQLRALGQGRLPIPGR